MQTLGAYNKYIFSLTAFRFDNHPAVLGAAVQSDGVTSSFTAQPGLHEVTANVP